METLLGIGCLLVFMVGFVILHELFSPRKKVTKPTRIYYDYPTRLRRIRVPSRMVPGWDVERLE